MNLLEAIQGAGENWFRPVGWVTSFSIQNGFLVKHQSWGDTVKLFTVPAPILTGEWEIVTPEQVLSERKL